MKILFIFFLLFSSLWAKPTYNIAIVEDGTSQYSKQLKHSLQNEITQLLNRDYEVKFPKKLYYNGKWKYQTIAADINLAMKNPNADMLITLGVLSSHYVARKHRFAKPVIATAILDPKMQGVPYKNGVSSKYNLTYVSGHQSIEQDIKTIKRLYPVKKIAVLVDAVLLKNTPNIGRYIKKKFAKNKLVIEIIPIGKHSEKDVEKITSDVDFVYVTPLFQQTKKERKKLYETLRLKELPSFSALGQDDVILGALFANAPANDNKRFIRQIALDVQQIALGSNASKQLVDFTPHPVLSLNMKTANDINYIPSWELLSKATIIESEQSDSHYFTIEEIMNRAVQYNLQIAIQKHQTEISQANLDTANSAYLPQVHFGAEAVQIDQDRAIASLGLENESRMDIYVKVSQQLFNQKALSQISINKNFLDAQNKATDFVKLDIGLSASLEYLRILQLRTKLKIEKSNLELSKTNMRSAITKRDIGIGNSSDIYRWQTQIAGEKKSLLFTHAALQEAKHTLNALLDLPQDLPLNFKPVDINNPIFMTHHAKMKQYFLNQKKFLPFQSFLIKSAKKNMPSIKQYHALKQARKLIVASNNYAFYMPTIAFEGGIKEHFISASNQFRDTNPDRFGDFPYADNTDWKVGLFLRFPLYEGGAKSAQLEASKASLLVAQAQNKNLLNNVEKNVRNALYQAKASYLSINLAQDASISSKKNLKLIKDIYVQGGTGIIELLDAQHTALRAALVENSNRYGFMRDLLILQHNIGQVNFDMKTQDWDSWIESLNSQLNATKEEE
jgi:outer membrane protein TolC